MTGTDMGLDNRIAAESAWLYCLFTLGPAPP